ncbi:hypothetical protein D1007_38598 [Hordeum vulgare]|nr:hypothetical protein D1007_38598 [Hordeum vulgare]
MANSGGHGNYDPERARRVRSDAARKRATRRYTRWGLTLPPSLLCHETEEYDRARGHLFSGSSSEASSSRSRSSLPSVTRELEELPLVKMEPEAEEVPERHAGGVVGPEHFLPPAEADNLLPALLARNAWEAEEERQRCRRDKEIDTGCRVGHRLRGQGGGVAPLSHSQERISSSSPPTTTTTGRCRIYYRTSSDELSFV